MKKDKAKISKKIARKDSLKKVKLTLRDELISLIGKFAVPNKSIKKLIDKSAAKFAPEIVKNRLKHPIVKEAENVIVEIEKTEAKTEKPKKLAPKLS